MTVTEVLQCEKSSDASPLDASAVEELVMRAVSYAREERGSGAAMRRRSGRVFSLYVLIAAAEIALLFALGCSVLNMISSVILLVVMCAGFGFYFWCFAPDRLPAYFDQYHLNNFNDGALRTNVAGVRFNNRNWPHIVQALRRAIAAIMHGYPILYLIVEKSLPAPYHVVVTHILMGAALICSLFLPVYIAGRKYE